MGVIVFHQGVLLVLHALGLAPFAPYSLAATAPLGVPSLISLAFWGGLWRILLTVLMERVPVADQRHHAMKKDAFAPVTPGEVLKAEFLQGYGLSQNRLARAIGISPNRIAEIVNNRRRITADTALRLALYFGNSPEFWMNLQSNYDLEMARKRLPAERAERIKSRRAA